MVDGNGPAGLAGLLSGSGALESTLVRVAELVVAAVPGADGAGLTLLEPDWADTRVASAEFVRAVDEVQYRLGEGPCVSAVAQRQPFTTGNLGGERRWPRFGPRVGRLGVHSALSLPLLPPGQEPPGQVLGVLNVYAHARDAFDDHSVALGVAFAGPAAVSVHNAQLLARAERLAAQLQHAMTSRAGIDQAMGVVMSRTGMTAPEAFARLRALSQSRSVKLADVAAELLDQAVRRARARQTHPAPQPSPGPGSGGGPTARYHPAQ